MSARPSRPALLAALAISLAAVPATPAAAKVRPLKGQVVGTPYVADTRSAIPVLLSKQTAKRAGLKSPVGVVIVPRSAWIPTPDGRSRPGNLRLGDRFRARGSITGEARRAVYPRIALRSRTVEVYRRGKTLSNAELEALVRRLQADLADVRAKLGDLAQYTLGELHGLKADLAALRADVGALQAQLGALEAVLAGLASELASVNAALSEQVAAVAGSLTTLTTQVTSALTELTEVQNLVTTLQTMLGGLDPAQLAAALSSITALESGLAAAVSDIAALTGILDGADGILGSADDPIPSLLAQVAGLSAADAALQAQVDGVVAEVDALQLVVGDATSGLVQQVATLTATVAIICGPASLLNSLC